MPTSNPNDPTQKNLAQQNRQKCVAMLDRITKTCYRMFRNSNLSKEIIQKKLGLLLKKLDQLGKVYLDTEYLLETRKYIEQLPKVLQSTQDIESLKNEQITQLNRLQKLKNLLQYKREKNAGVIDMDA